MRYLRVNRPIGKGQQKKNIFGGKMCHKLQIYRPGKGIT